MKFIIFYGDGSIFEGESTEDAFRALVLDVQVIAQAHPEATNGRNLLHSTPYYIWLDGVTWSPTDHAGFECYIRESGPKMILFGRTMVNTSEFNALISRAEKIRY